MAQAVERILGKDEVASSILASSSKKALANAGAFFYMICPTHQRGRSIDKNRYMVYIIVGNIFQ